MRKPLAEAVAGDEVHLRCRNLLCDSRFLRILSERLAPENRRRLVLTRCPTCKDVRELYLPLRKEARDG